MASSIFPSSLKQDTPYFVCYPRSTFWQPHTYNALCLLHTWGYHKKGRRVPKGASSKTRRLNGERKKWVPNNANEMWTRCQAPSEKRLFCCIPMAGIKFISPSPHGMADWLLRCFLVLTRFFVHDAPVFEIVFLRTHCPFDIFYDLQISSIFFKPLISIPFASLVFHQSKSHMIWKSRGAWNITRNKVHYC